jgi:hypothetical protein
MNKKLNKKQKGKRKTERNVEKEGGKWHWSEIKKRKKENQDRR